METKAKFKSRPYKCESDEVLISDMKNVAASLNQNFLSTPDYDKYGEYCHGTIIRRFGSWAKACEKAGLELTAYQKNCNIGEETLIGDLRRVAEDLKKKNVLVREYGEFGRYGPNAIIHRFGSWNAALKAAGLEITIIKKYTDEEMFAELGRLWNKLGRQPKSTDFLDGASTICINTFFRRFGGWRGALDAFISRRI